MATHAKLVSTLFLITFKFTVGQDSPCEYNIRMAGEGLRITIPTYSGSSINHWCRCIISRDDTRSIDVKINVTMDVVRSEVAPSECPPYFYMMNYDREFCPSYMPSLVSYHEVTMHQGDEPELLLYNPKSRGSSSTIDIRANSYVMVDCNYIPSVPDLPSTCPCGSQPSMPTARSTTTTRTTTTTKATTPKTTPKTTPSTTPRSTTPTTTTIKVTPPKTTRTKTTSTTVKIIPKTTTTTRKPTTTTKLVRIPTSRVPRTSKAPTSKPYCAFILMIGESLYVSATSDEGMTYPPCQCVIHSDVTPRASINVNVNFTMTLDKETSTCPPYVYATNYDVRTCVPRGMKEKFQAASMVLGDDPKFIIQNPNKIGFTLMMSLKASGYIKVDCETVPDPGKSCPCPAAVLAEETDKERKFILAYGIVSGLVVATIVLICCICFCCRRTKEDKSERGYEEATLPRNSSLARHNKPSMYVNGDLEMRSNDGKLMNTSGSNKSRMSGIGRPVPSLATSSFSVPPPQSEDEDDMNNIPHKEFAMEDGAWGADDGLM